MRCADVVRDRDKGFIPGVPIGLWATAHVNYYSTPHSQYYSLHILTHLCEINDSIHMFHVEHISTLCLPSLKIRNS